MAATYSRVMRCFLFLSAISSVASAIARGDDVAASALPPKVENVLRWLPEDTETLIVGQSFKIPSMKDREAAAAAALQAERSDPDINELIQSLAMAPLLYMDNQKHADGLAGKKVVLALRGGRNFERVSSLGSLRDEGSAVIVFENNIDATWLSRLRDRSQEIRKIAHREVLVFPLSTVMDGWVSEMPWQGTFVVILEPKILLCATSDRYLSEILSRVDTNPVKRALPDDLPEWKHLDLKTPNWLLRHLPNGTRTLSGLTLSVKNKGFQVDYLPFANSVAGVRNQAHKWWSPPPSANPADIQLQKDGTVTVTSNINEPFIMHVYGLQGVDGKLWAGDESE